MFWSSGSAQMVRIGDRLFVSAFEAVPGAAPLNNARWALYERSPEGWRFCQRDLKDRTREPCSLAASHASRLVMSVNPTLAPLAPAPAQPVGGPARPEFLDFDPNHPEREPRHLVPEWDGEPKFTEYTYRAFAMRIEPDGSISARVCIPLSRPITSTFLTATPRAGNPLTEAADLLIADSVDGKPAARYARIRFVQPAAIPLPKNRIGKSR